MSSTAGTITAPPVEPDSTPPIEPEHAPPERSGGFAALRDRNFARYWTTLSLSLTGGWVRVTAMGYLVYEITGDPFKLAMINVAMAVPQLLANLVAGNILDHVDRRRVLVFVQIAYMAAMAVLVGLVLAGDIAYWHLVALSVLIGIAVGFDWPARLSLVPSLVTEDRLQSAIALNPTAFNGARIVGPSLGGWLIAGVGTAAAFGVTLVAALPYALILLGLTLVRPQVKRSRGNVLDLMKEGYGYIWRHGEIRSLMSVEIVPIALGMSYVTLAPAVASDVLDVGSRGLGAMLAAVGVGALAGSVIVAARVGMRRRGRLVIVGVGVFGALSIVYALSGSIYLTLPIMFLMGLTTALYSTTKETLVQTLVDDAYRGRVMATNSVFWGFTPLGSLLAGAMAAVVGLQAALAINGALVLLYAPLLWLATPVRDID